MEDRWLKLRAYLLRCIFAVVGISVLSESGLAQNSTSEPNRFIFSPGIFFRDEQKSLNEKSRSEIILWDINFGYQFLSNWYVGGLYSYERERVRATSYPIADINTNYEYIRSALGISFGYIYYSYYTRVSYLGSSEWQVDENNQSIKYTGGWGVQVDLGLNFLLFENFLLGPKLSFKHFEYSKLSDSQVTQSLSRNLVRNTWDPYFCIWWEF